MIKVDDMLRKRITAAGGNDDAPANAFMLNGKASITYPYTNEDIVLIDHTFDVLTHLKYVKGDGVYYALYSILSEIMNVPDTGLRLLRYNALVPESNHNLTTIHKTYTRDEYEQDKQELLNKYDGDKEAYHRFVVLNNESIFVYANAWTSSFNERFIMNFDVKASLKALRTINDYGLRDVIDLFLIIYAVRGDEKNDDYAEWLGLVRQLVMSNDRKSLSTMFNFIHNLFITNDLGCPSYAELIAARTLPANIINTDIMAGDYDKPYVRDEKRIIDELESSPASSRRTMLLSLLPHADYTHERLNTSDSSEPAGSLVGTDAAERRMVKLVEKFMRPEYTEAWSLLDEAMANRPWQMSELYAYDITYLLPWNGEGLCFGPDKTSEFISMVLPYPDRIRRLGALLATRRQFKDLWVQVNGNGYGSFACNHKRKQSLSRSELIPRRFWNYAGDVYNLDDYFLVNSYSHLKGLPDPAIMPDDFIDYIIDGYVPVQLVDTRFIWSIYSYEHEDDGVLLSKETVNASLKVKGCNDGVVFRLRGGEAEKEWLAWADSLNKASGTVI